MSLGDVIAQALPRLRAEAESLMQDTCRVTTPGTPVWDDATGTYTSAPATIYEGKCRIRRPAAAPQTTDSGETAWAVDVLTLSLPIAGTAGVKDGHDVEILTSAHDPAAVGLALVVQGGHWQTHSTARRIPVKVVTHDG